MKTQKLILSSILFITFICCNYSQITTNVSNDKASGNTECNDYYNCGPCGHLQPGTVEYDECFHQHQQLKVAKPDKESKLLLHKQKKMNIKEVKFILNSLLLKYRNLIFNN